MSSYAFAQRALKKEFKKPSRTKQSFKDECDIKKIMERHKMTGFISANKAKPMSGDFTKVEDYHTALNMINDANERFVRMPARLRDRFDNNPVNMLAFLEDEKNRDEAVKLGLVNEKKPDGGSTPSGAAGSSGGDLGTTSGTSQQSGVS